MLEATMIYYDMFGVRRLMACTRIVYRLLGADTWKLPRGHTSDKEALVNLMRLNYLNKN